MKYEVFKPQHFATSLDSLAKQVLPPEVYKKYGVTGLQFIDDRLLTFIDKLRKNLGVPLVVNNGSTYTQSGLRDEDFYGTPEKLCKSFSQHRFGRGVDFRSSKMSSQEIRRHIIENKHLYPEVSFIEVGISWVHIDVRTRMTNEWCRFWSPSEGFVTEQEVLERNL